MDITGYTRKVLEYLYKQQGERGNIYGNISANIGLRSADKSEEICKILYAYDLAEYRDERVFIKETGRKWVERFYVEQEERIYEFVYEDYKFALLRFLYEQDLPIGLDEFPEILKDEAPKNTRGYPSMNLLHMLDIEFSKYVDTPMNKYELNSSGRKYFEHLAKKKNFPLTLETSAKNTKQVHRIFISYARANKQWLVKVQTHLKALKNYSQIEFEYWDDTKLIGGDNWEITIKQELDQAVVAILLISTEFFASDFKAKELAPLLKNAESKGTRIIPLIIGHSIFTDTPIAQFQAANDTSHPLSSMNEPDQDKILVALCRTIQKHLLENRGHL
jgi:hypothetical protein